MQKVTDERFIAAYNNTRKGLRMIAQELGMNYRAVIRRADRMRNAGIPLVDRKAAYIESLKGDVEIAEPVSGDRPIEEVVRLAMEHSDRQLAAAKAASLVDVKINIDGPFAIVGLPDPHLDNPGTDLRRAMTHAELIRDTEGVYAICVGDILDNFHAVRPLHHARNEHVVTVNEAYRLQEHWLTILAPKLVGVSSGNHDDWSTRSGADPLSYAMRQLNKSGIYGQSQVRVRLKVSGASFIHLIRHTFPGSSVYNSGHGVLKWALQQWQGEDVMWGGHIHSSAIQQITKPVLGGDKVVTLMQLGAYKKVDHYALERGFRINTPHDAAMVVHDPSTGETFPFASIERGIEFLSYLRRKAA
ncbi:hypothetical protein [Aquitalea sp. USM4]|uniref:hypothetical protein n=1 Tax=Aquitalea sp. USM4 TaxID=1590041 RepID=UPI00103E7E9A|nr:hypothetical protein [Aquitalea sp. USM4]QBJ80528.1 hypothetical protein DKK66_19985 [Aquitalea sp. USM4]